MLTEEKINKKIKDKLKNLTKQKYKSKHPTISLILTEDLKIFYFPSIEQILFKKRKLLYSLLHYKKLSATR